MADDWVDAFDDPLSEVGDLVKDLPLPADVAKGVDAATLALQNAMADLGVPDETYRFLVDGPDWTKRTSAQATTEEYIQKVGHVADNLFRSYLPGWVPAGATTGLASTVTSAVHRGQGTTEDQPERPRWLVYSMRAEEGLSMPFYCELELVRPEIPLVDPAHPTTVDALAAAYQGGAPGPLGFATDALNAAAGTVKFVQQLMNPYGDSDGDGTPDIEQMSDRQDPDALDPKNVPSRIGPQANLADCTIEPAKWLDKFARIGVARRWGPKALQTNPNLKTPGDYYTLSERWLSGICTEVEDLGDVDMFVHRVRIVIRPRLWKLSLRKRCRIFQDRNAIEIIKQLLAEHQIYPVRSEDETLAALQGELVLKPGGLAAGPLELPAEVAALPGLVGDLVGGDAGQSISGVLEKNVEDWTPKREYCVQYDETDLELFERLLAEEGIAYYFDCAERRETLVLAEDPTVAGKKVLTVDRRPLPIASGQPLGLADIQVSFAERAWLAGVSRELAPSAVTVRDFNFSLPNRITELRAGSQLPALGGAGALDVVTEALTMAADALSAGSGATAKKDYSGAESKLFEYPGELTLALDGKHTSKSAKYGAYSSTDFAEIELDAARTRATALHAWSAVTSIAPGNHVNVINGAFDAFNPNPLAPMKYLVTWIRHSGLVTASPGEPLLNPGLIPPAGPPAAGPPPVAHPTLGQSQTTRPRYRNELRALPTQLRWRPERPRSRPRIPGLQTATVIDIACGDDATKGHLTGEEVHVDDGWRVMVRFPWDRGSKDDEKLERTLETKPAGLAGKEDGHSCWIRVAQPFAGGGFGTLFAPRVGMEVVVAFLEGNPDRPVIVGCVYNGRTDPNTNYPLGDAVASKHASTVDIASLERKTQTTIHTRSWTREEPYRGNELRFDDGPEKIYLHAQRDLDEVIKHDHITTVYLDQTNTVGEKQVEVVKGDQTLHVTRVVDGAGTTEKKGQNAAAGAAGQKDPMDWSRKKTVRENETVNIGRKPGQTPAGPAPSGDASSSGVAAESTPAVPSKPAFRHEAVTDDEIVVIGKNRDEKVGNTERVVIEGADAKAKDAGQQSVTSAEAARLLKVWGSNVVSVAATDLLRVTGDHLTHVNGALKITAASIHMSTSVPGPGGGPPEPNPKDGITIDKTGVSVSAKNRIAGHADGDFTIRSDGKDVVFSAKTVLALDCGGSSITLDAATGTITVQADDRGALQLSGSGAKMTLGADGITLDADDSKLVADVGGSDQKTTIESRNGKLEMQFEGEIHFNAAHVRYQTAAGKTSTD